MDLKELSLEQIGNGVIPELFSYELDRLLKNIDDPNTSPTAQRKITITLTFVPAPSRDAAGVKISVSSALAGTQDSTASVYISRDGGKLKAFTVNPNQIDMFQEKVVPLQKEGGQ